MAGIRGVMSSKLNSGPSRMDVVQSLSGLLLVLFIWGHMFFESSILLGKDAMLWVTKMFEGEHLLQCVSFPPPTASTGHFTGIWAPSGTGTPPFGTSRS